MNQGPAFIIAKGILHDRRLRRKMLFQVLIALLLSVFIGNWVLDGWLANGLWRFILWWGGVAFLTLFILLFALYDAMRAVQEEREEMLRELKRSAEDLKNEET